MKRIQNISANREQPFIVFSALETPGSAQANQLPPTLLSRQVDESLYPLLEKGKIGAELKIRAAAKINLNLKILGKRKDGFHELETVMQSIALSDLLKISIAPAEKSEIKLSSNILIGDQIEDNIAYRAAKLFLDKFQLTAKVIIQLQKNIPLAAGLAGGSTDAAGVLAGLARLYNNHLARRIFKSKNGRKQKGRIDFADLLPLAEELGADVPFCLHGGTAICQGKGELITPLNDFENQPLLLYNPGLPIYTREAFAALNAKDHNAAERSDNSVQAKIKMYNQKMTDCPEKAKWHNDFTDYILDTYPQLIAAREKLFHSGACFVGFTGSGPTLYAFYKSFERRDQALQSLSDQLTGQLIASYSISSQNCDLLQS